MKKQTIKLNEGKLKNIIRKTLKEALDGMNNAENNWYVCSETVYDYGEVHVWITTNQEEVEEANMCSEGNADGPYSKEEAYRKAMEEVKWGEKNGAGIYTWKYVGESGEDTNDTPINESRLRNVIKKAIKEALDLSPYDGFSVNTSTGEDNNCVYGYHLVHDENTAREIMKNGFKLPKYTGEGMYHGVGIYIFPDDLNRLRGYRHVFGNIAIRVKIIGDNFQTHPSQGWEIYVVPNPEDVIPVSIKRI